VLIYVCSSSHGFGHAARDAAVLQHLRLRRPDWTLVMSSMVEPRFLRLLLGDDTITIRPCRWDVGMVQADALGVDRSQTLAALRDLETALPDQLMGEVEWLRAQADTVLILGDIPPAAAELAACLDAPLVWMSNFGWDEIYRPLGVAFERWADAALAQYKRGQLLLRCPFDLSMNWGLQELALGLVCTSPRPLPSDWQRAMSSPQSNAGFGGFRWLGSSARSRTISSLATPSLFNGLSSASRSGAGGTPSSKSQLSSRLRAADRCLSIVFSTIG
jgi:hypothetical protein